MPTTEHVYLPLYADDETPDLSTTGNYNQAMVIIDGCFGLVEKAVTALAEGIAEERESRIAGDNALDSKLAAETQARTDADAALDTAYKAADAELTAKLAAETKARTDADAALDTAYKAADTALGSRIENAEADINANSADLTGIKGLTYGSKHVQFIESENGSYSSPALEEIAKQVTALETVDWSDIRGKPFSTISSGLKAVSDALTVDDSSISAGITGNTTWGEIVQS